MSQLRSLVQRARSLFAGKRPELLEAEVPVPAGLPDHCVLLGGQPRSGTSLLTSILRTSADLFQAYELHIRKPSFVAGNGGRYTRRIFEQLGLPEDEYEAALKSCATLQARMNLGAWAGPKEEVSAEPLTGRETNKFGEELGARAVLTTELMRRVAQLHGRPRWGFKILGDVIHAQTYARAWPNATMILMVRDPRDHALSIMELNRQRAERGQPDFYSDYAAVARGWRQTVEQGRRAIEKSGLRLVTVRYEDLVREPDQEFRRLSEELQIDLSRGHHFYEQGYVASHSRRFEHHDNLRNPINPDSLGKWRRLMSEAERAVFAEIAGDLMLAYGYELH